MVRSLSAELGVGLGESSSRSHKTADRRRCPARPTRQKGDDDDSEEESGSEEDSDEESSEDDGPAVTVGFTADPKKAAAFGVRPSSPLPVSAV